MTGTDEKKYQPTQRELITYHACPFLAGTISIAFALNAGWHDHALPCALAIVVALAISLLTPTHPRA